MDWRHFLRAAFWFGLYLSLILSPLFVLLIGPAPPGRGFWWEFSAALGYASLAALGVQFALTARFRRATAPYGIDLIYYFHRQISLVVFAFVVLHITVFFIESPSYLLRLVNPATAVTHSFAAMAGFLAFGGILVISLGRKKLRIPYERWRLWHGILAVAAVGMPLAHAFGVGYYLTSPWKRAFWGLYVIFWIWLLAYVRVVKPLLMLRRPYVVEEVARQRGGSWSLVLLPESHGGLRFKAGQFAWLTLWKSPFAIEEHPFSISSSASRPGRLEFIIKERGDFTSTIGRVKKGQRVYLDGPYGSFVAAGHKTARGFCFIAGGIGIAPVMSMLRTFSDRDERRPLVLVYANATLEKAVFREEIADLERKLNLRVVHVLEHPPEDWTGETGYATADVLGRHLPEERNRYEYFVCGPDPMMDLVERALYGLGISIARFHSERFDIV